MRNSVGGREIGPREIAPREVVYGVVLSVLLAAVFVNISHVLSFAHINESISNQYGLLRGEDFSYDGVHKRIAPYYNRILFPLLLTGARDLLGGFSEVQRFLLLRFLTSFICFLIIYVVSIRRTGRADTLLICLTAEFCLVAQAVSGWITPGDVIDLTLCLLMFLWLLEGAFWPAFAIACLTAINRETGAFAAVAFGLMNLGRMNWLPLIGRCLLIAVVPFALAVLVRKSIVPADIAAASTGQTAQGWLWNLREILVALKRPTPTSWLLMILASVIVPWAVLLSRPLPAVPLPRIALVYAVMFGVTAWVGIMEEVRIFLPCAGFVLACMLTAPRNSTLSGVR